MLPSRALASLVLMLSLACISACGGDPVEQGIEGALEMLEVERGGLPTPRFPTTVTALGSRGQEPAHPPAGEAAGPVQIQVGALEAAYAQARTELERLAERHPQDARVAVALAQLYYLQAEERVVSFDHGQLREASRAWFRRAVELDRGSRDAWWGLFVFAADQDWGSLVQVGDGDRLVKDWPELRRVAEAMLGFEQDNPLARLLLALALYHTGSVEEARGMLEALVADGALESIPERELTALLLLAHIAENRGDAEGLAAVSARITSRLDGVTRGDGYYPGCPYQVLGLLYRDMGEQQLAEEFIHEAALLDTRATREALDRAVALFHGGSYGAAVRLLERIEGSFPLIWEDRELVLDIEARTHALHALCLTTQRRGAEARRQLALAQQRRVDLPLARVAEGHLALGERRHEPARALFEGALAEGELAGGEGSVVGVSAARQQAWRMARLGLAWIAANQQDFEAALPQYTALLAGSPEDALALHGQATALVGLQRLDEAEEVLHRLLALEPGNPHALSELGLVHLNRGQLEEAERAFTAALERADPSFSCPFEGLGLVMLRQGRREQAAAQLERAIEVNPDIEYKKYNALARLKLEAGNPGRARELLQRSVANYPQDDEARRLLQVLDGGPPPPAVGPGGAPPVGPGLAQ